MFSVHAMVGGGQSTAARSAQVEVILELSRDVFFRSRMFFPTPPHAHPPPSLLSADAGCMVVLVKIMKENIKARRMSCRFL